MAEHTYKPFEGLPSREPVPHDMTLADMFPPPGTRYFTDEQIERLRQATMPLHDPTAPVVLTAWAAMCLICDWRNMTTELADQSALLRVVKAAKQSVETCTFCEGSWYVEADGVCVDCPCTHDYLTQAVRSLPPHLAARLSEGE